MNRSNPYDDEDFRFWDDFVRDMPTFLRVVLALITLLLICFILLIG